MIDLIDNRTLMIVGCTALVLVGLVGVRWAMIPARRELLLFAQNRAHSTQDVSDA
jgi:hypothetical protein